MRACLLILLSIIGMGTVRAQLIINEFSNGPATGAGTKEYVEFLVVGTPGCTAQCVDLRGWVFDDNNGTFGSAGIATGHFRFANVATWSCVPIGTLIVVYNEAEKNAAIPADNLTGANCVYILPANSNLIEHADLSPISTGSSAYTGPYSTGGTGANWVARVGMANGGDTYQVRSPSALTVPYHAIGYGTNNNSADTIIYFTGGGAATVFSMTNDVSNNPFLKTNWTSASVLTAGAETPGLPNNTANATWIHSMNNNCQPIVLPTVVAHNDTAICAGRTAKLYATPSVTGGTFLWSNAATTDTILVTPAVTTTYTVEYTSVGGCKDTDTVVVTVNPSFIATVATTNASCAVSNGTATANPSGAGYTYQWSTSPIQTTQTISGLGANTYTVTVTNSSGCTATASGTVTQSSATTVTASVTTPISCAGVSDGVLTAIATGGLTPYTYTWSTTPTQTTQSISGVKDGTYSITVADAANCTAAYTVRVTEPVVLTAPTTQTNVTCASLNNGTAQVNAAGGTTPYAYVWSTLPPQTTAGITGLAPNTYTVIVTDAHLCSATASVTITEPNALTLNVTATATTCGLSNGTATTTVTGGTTPYAYLWNNTETRPNLTGLAAGNYTVTVSDANGCTINNNAAVAIVATSIGVTATATATNTTCNGTADGQVATTVTSGTAPYSYLWDTNPAQTTATATSLSAGTYTVTVTDNAGCKDTIAAIVTSPAPVIFNATGTDVTCFGKGDGTIVLDNTNLTYSLNGGPFGSQTTFTNLPAGTDTIIGKDATGCADTLINITITEPQALTVVISPDSALVTRGEQVTLDATTTGGTSPIVYDWQPTTGLSCADCSSQSITPADSITYVVVVTDTRGCTATDTADVYVRSAFLIVFPSAFTPNGDSKNDVFRAISNGPVDTYNLKVFNRWGTMVFESNELKHGWDGTYKGDKQNIDTFTWLCEYKQMGASKSETMKGNVTIIK